MEPLTILTAFAPIVIEGVKGLIARFTGNTPAITTPADYAAVVDADIRKLQALASLDMSSGQTSPWVNNLKSLQRIIVVYATIGSWIAATFFVVLPDDRYKLVSSLASAIFFFLFGDRVNFYMKKGK